MSTNTPLQSEQEDLGNGILRTWYADRKLFVLKGTKSTRSGADTWANAMFEVLENWDVNQPFLAVHDFRTIGMTPYNRIVAAKVAQAFPEKCQGRYVVVVGEGVIGYALKYFAQRDLKRMIPQLDSQVLFDYDKAFAWVAELLDAK